MKEGQADDYIDNVNIMMSKKHLSMIIIIELQVIFQMINCRRVNIALIN